MVEFIPKSSTSKNVTPYGQTVDTPFFNGSTLNYCGKNMNITLYLNGSSDCVNLTISTNSTKADGFQITNHTWTDLNTELAYMDNPQWWLWADYGCDDSSWQWWFPDLYFRGCCVDCLCSEDLE